jgi:hypothetical protein
VLSLDPDGVVIGHATTLRRSITKGSIFYRKKMILQYMVSAMYQFFQGVRITDVLRNHSICANTLSQLLYDCQVIMLSDYESHNLGEDYLLGNNSRCHHIQIDESKLGKRKHNRGRHVEGIWVLGLVEALVPEDPNRRTYEYIDVVTGITETRYHFEAGNRIFLTVPNRTAATLLPIIYKFCKPRTVIRSDGWRAYRNLHRTTHVDDGQLDFNGENNQLFFRAHQVVNHSQGFTTVDQVTNNPEVSLTPVSGHLHTNIIESLWRDLKVFIGPRYRNSKDCPGKLLEYLWRYANKGSFIIGMRRCIREVEVMPGTGVNEDGPEFFTAGQDGEDLEAQERRLRREEQMFEQWISRRRARDEDEEVLSDSDGDNDDPRDQDYVPASIRISRPLPFGEVPAEVNIRSSGRATNAPRRRVGRPSGFASSTTAVAGRGRPSGRGSRGRGRPRGSTTRNNRT